MLLTSKAERGRILLQTPSDGYTGDALKMLRGLPAWIARQKKWRAEMIAEDSRVRKLSLETFQEWERRHGSCELCLVELAAWIVAAMPMRWRVVPPHFQKAYLADYDRDESLHIRVVIMDDESYRVLTPGEDKQDFTVALIDTIHKQHLRMAERIRKRSNSG